MATMRTALILRQSFRISFSPNPPRVQIPALTLPHARIGRVRSNATGPGSGGGERKVPSRLSQMQKILQESEERAFSADAGPTTKITLGVLTLFVQQSRHYTSSFHTSRLDKYRGQYALPCSIRSLSSHSSSESPKKAANEDGRKDIATSEDPFDAPTYNIPEKPMTFAEGASYSVVILAGLGVAAVAAYAVFKELIFEPKEYKIFGKALARIQHDSQVRVRIGSPVTGYGQESMNRAARQRIPHRSWTDEDGIEHVEVNFYIRGPHGAGKVFSEMFKDNTDKQWKFTYLIVEIMSPSPAQLMLESYVPA